VIAYTSSALILLVLACSYPFMSFKASGLESLMTLPQTAFNLWRDGMPVLSFLVATFIIFLPALILALILALNIALHTERHYHWLRPIGRMIYSLQGWCMVEVFFIGVLVSLVKVGHMATVVMGLSFWAYAVFSLFFVLSLSGLDRAQCWRRIERLQP
jgi:paraquat-inducible protein A